MLIAGLGGYLLWDNLREDRGLKANRKRSSPRSDYADQEDFKTAGEKVAPLLDDGSPGARTAARLIQAGAALEAGEIDKAAGLFQQVADDADAPPALRDLARIRDVAARYDSMEPADVIGAAGQSCRARQSVFRQRGRIWWRMARLEAGNRTEAGRLFAEIAKDEEQPENIAFRAHARWRGCSGSMQLSMWKSCWRTKGWSRPGGEWRRCARQLTYQVWTDGYDALQAGLWTDGYDALQDCKNHAAGRDDGRLP